jgi:peptide/nickel transport system substrate-binding protein
MDNATHARSRREALRLGAAGAVLAALDQLGAPQAAAQEAAPRQGGALTYAQCSGNRRGGDATNTRHPYFMIDLITRSAYNTLAWVDEKLGVVNELATQIAPTDESLAVWEVTIREGVRFHDGSPMTARDVAASFELHRRRNFASQQIQRTEVVNPTTVRFFLDAGNSEFPFVLAEYDNVVMPADDWEKIGLTGIGTGPFRIVASDPQRRMVFERNEHYWRQGRPYLDRLEVVNREGQMEAALNGYRARQFDAVLNIDPRLTRQLEREPETDLVPAASGDQAVIILPKHPGSPFMDVRLRRALAYAIDREAVVRIVYGGPRWGWVGNDSHLAGNDPMAVPRPVNRDLARARALLAEAGHPNGITLPTLYYAPQWPEMARYFQVIQEQVREAGITLPIEERPNDGYLRFRTGEADVAKGNWHKFAYTAVGPRNPGISLFRMRPANNESGYWSGPAADRYMELYRRAMVTASTEARRALYGQMQQIVYEEVPAILPAGRNNVLIKRRSVVGLRNHPQHWSITWDDVFRTA